MRLLAIETSCDDASVAIVEGGTAWILDVGGRSSDSGSRMTPLRSDKLELQWGAATPVRILAERTASQIDIHNQYGGVFPELAAREHFATLLPTIEETLLAYAPDADPRETLKNLDAIAVTAGPGLIGSLLVGVTVAQALAMGLGKKLIPVNHLAGHIYSTWLEDAAMVDVMLDRKADGPSAAPDQASSQQIHGSLISDSSEGRSGSRMTQQTPQFPLLALTVSGGHTQLVWMEGHGRFEVLGRTRDDAAGEAFDKVSVMLGLGYPGGPAIQSAAADWKSQIPSTKFQTSTELPIPKFPRPMIDEGFEFSFSGLKTAVRYWLDGVHDQLSMTNDELLPADIVSLAAQEVQEAITDVLVTKLLRAAEERRPSSIILAGGVAANTRLREKLIEALADRQLLMTNDQLPIRPHISSRPHSTDNGAMIGAAALAMLATGYKPVDPAHVEARSSWPLENWQ